jgi:predicted AlkP superfamily pyrophosphatase or phosphodiesterase
MRDQKTWLWQHRLWTAFCLATVCGSVRPGVAAEGAIKHVVIVGIDGLAPAGIRDAKAPTFARLRAHGAWTMHARAVMPTSSSPNWASMIMGAGPEQHGVTSNDWERDKFTFEPVVRGPEGIYPTMFGVLRNARRSSVIGVFHDWDGFGRLVERQSCDAVENADGPDDAMNRAIAFWESRKPTLLFVHLDHVDHAGHSEGWGSPAYLQAVEKADQLIAKLLASIKDSHLEQETMLLVTADHGGIGKKHGGETMAELEIPWIASGPGVRQGAELTVPVNTYDTAPTVLKALGVSPPSFWIGRAITEAFEP